MKCGQRQACDKAHTRHHLNLSIPMPTFRHKSGRAIQRHNGITTVQSAILPNTQPAILPTQHAVFVGVYLEQSYMLQHLILSIIHNRLGKKVRAFFHRS